MTNKKSIEDLQVDISVFIKAMYLPCKKHNIVGNFPDVFEIKPLGIVLTSSTYTEIKNIEAGLITLFPGYRIIIIHEYMDLNSLETRKPLIWEFARSGYFRYLRQNHLVMFERLVINENYSHLIINKRLDTWKDLPKFKLFIESNKQALVSDTRRVLAQDPSFFDYLPEE